jgi:Protein of unknown function (DUF1257)
MSAYKFIKCSFKDKNTLLESLENLGFNPVVYTEKHHLMGYQNDSREEKAEIIVPKSQISHVSNDLGFSYDEESKEYLMICSDYDKHKGLADKIKQSYAVTAIKIALKKNKFSIQSETKNKSITISASKII